LMGGFDSVRHVRPSNGASVVVVQINGPGKIAGAKFDATSPDVNIAFTSGRPRAVVVW
jgi:hypothetical protein